MKTWIARVLPLIFGMSLCAYAGICWRAAGEISSPSRKPLQSLHRGWVKEAGNHGMTVKAFVGQGVPALLCEPAGHGGPGYRGRILRHQVQSGGETLPAFGQVTGTLVLLHGRGQRKEDLLLVAERFCAVGLRCLLPDLPGHGDNPAPVAHFGMDAGERELPGRMLDAAAEKFGFNPYPADLWGMSMGGAYALAAAAESGRWDALVVVSSFDALEPLLDDGMRQRGWRWTAVMRPGLRLAIRTRAGFWSDRLRPVDAARKVGAPVFVVHGTADTLIRSMRGRRLFEALPAGPKRWVEVEGARHGNVLVTTHPLFAEMSAWYLAWMSPAQRAVVVRSK